MYLGMVLSRIAVQEKQFWCHSSKACGNAIQRPNHGWAGCLWSARFRIRIHSDICYSLLWLRGAQRGTWSRGFPSQGPIFACKKVITGALTVDYIFENDNNTPQKRSRRIRFEVEESFGCTDQEITPYPTLVFAKDFDFCGKIHIIRPDQVSCYALIAGYLEYGQIDGDLSRGMSSLLECELLPSHQVHGLSCDFR